MKTLSIRQPWAWAILNAGKDIENRTWPTKIRGRIFIHAPLKTDWNGVVDLEEKFGIKQSGFFLTGGIVGSIEIVDCVKKSESKWFDGPYGFVLANPHPLPFTPVRGQLGFFEYQEKNQYKKKESK